MIGARRLIPAFTLALLHAAAPAVAADALQSAGEREPAPYLAAAPEPPAKSIELGAMGGVVWHHGSSSSVQYPATLAYGATLRVDLREWLGLRGLVLHSTQSVDTAPTRAAQPDLDVLLLGLRLEPSLQLTPRLRGWAGLSAGWLRSEAPPVDGALTGVRLGTGLDLGAALGVGYDVLAKHLAVGASVGASWIASQGGDMFDSADALDANGHRTTVAGLPKYAGGLDGLLGVEVAW